jgi:hypothetical protein
MRNWKKILIGSLAAVGALYLFMLVMVSFVAEPDCTVYPVRREPSPGGRFTVVLEHRECRSNRGIAAEVWVSEQGSRTSSGVFRSPASIEIGSGRYLKVEPVWAWLSETELQITYPRGVTPTSGEGVYGNVKVVYVPVNDLHPN